MEGEEIEANEWKPPFDGGEDEEVFKEREIVCATFGQLRMVNRLVADKLHALGANVA